MPIFAALSHSPGIKSTDRYTVTNYNCSCECLTFHLGRINKTRKAYKVTNEHVRHLMDVLGKQHQITLDDLHSIMSHKYNDFVITKQHMGKIIRDNNRTYKRVKVRHIPLTRFGKAVDVSGQLNDFYAVLHPLSGIYLQIKIVIGGVHLC